MMASGKSREVKVDIVVDAAKAQAGAKQAEKALGDLGNTTDKVGAQSGRLGSEIEGLKGKVGDLAGPAAAGAVVAFGIKAYQAFASGAEGVLKFERVAGTTAEESGRWIEAFDDYGLSADESATLVGKFAKVVGTTPKVLADLGIELAKNADGTVNLSATMQNAASVFAITTDETKRAEIGSKLFGKQWQSMIPILEQGANGLKRSFDGVAKTKLLTQEQIDQAERTRLALDQVSDVAQGLMRQIGAGLAPAVEEGANTLTAMATAVDKLAGGNGSGGLSGLTERIGNFIEGAGGLRLLENSVEKFNELTGAAADMSDVVNTATDSTGSLIEVVKGATKSTKDLADQERAGAVVVRDAAAANREAATQTTNRARAATDAVTAVRSQFDAEIAARDALRQVADASKAATVEHGRNAEANDRLATSILNAAEAEAKQAGLKEGTAEWADFTGAKVRELAGSYASTIPEIMALLDEYIEKLRQAKIRADMLALGSGSAPGYGTGQRSKFGVNDPQASSGGLAGAGVTLNLTVNTLKADASLGAHVTEAIVAAQRAGLVAG